MSKPIVLTEKQWLDIYNHIAKNYPSSVLLISWRLKDKLGFTVRRHQEYRDYNNPKHDNLSWDYFHSVRLDFYDDVKRTMFLLKYSDIINDKEKSLDVI